MSVFNLIIAGFAAFVAGIINSVAGGGTLITFPILTALGLPVVVANITNTVALCPGYLSGTLAQKNDLAGQKSRLLILIPLSIFGGVLGGIILIYTGDKNFRIIVPYLILMASMLLAFQNKIKGWITSRGKRNNEEMLQKSVVILLILLAAVYGGYFGAGASIVIFALLALLYNDSLIRLNALKQSLAFSINVSAAIYFCFSGKVCWKTALIMALGAIIGGRAGGKLSTKMKPNVLRWTVVIIGIAVASYYFII